MPDGASTTTTRAADRCCFMQEAGRWVELWEQEAKDVPQTKMFKSVYWSYTHKVLIYNQEKREEKRWAIVFKSWISFSCPRGSGQLVKKYNIQKHILTQTHTKTSQLLTEKVKTKALQYYYYFFGRAWLEISLSHSPVWNIFHCCRHCRKHKNNHSLTFQ